MINNGGNFTIIAAVGCAMEFSCPLTQSINATRLQLVWHDLYEVQP